MEIALAWLELRAMQHDPASPFLCSGSSLLFTHRAQYSRLDIIGFHPAYSGEGFVAPVILATCAVMSGRLDQRLSENKTRRPAVGCSDGRPIRA
jgi:hypothetical protein